MSKYREGSRNPNAYKTAIVMTSPMTLSLPGTSGCAAFLAEVVDGQEDEFVAALQVELGK